MSGARFFLIPSMEISSDARFSLNPLSKILEPFTHTLCFCKSLRTLLCVLIPRRIKTVSSRSLKSPSICESIYARFQKINFAFFTKKHFRLWNFCVAWQNSFSANEIISRFTQRIFCLWNFCIVWQNAFSWNAIISWLAQCVFLEWNYFTSRQNTFSKNARISFAAQVISVLILKLCWLSFF